MTLSGWFKAYVYSPCFLSLMRRFPSPQVQPTLGVVTYFVTFFLVGAWHGQTRMFLFYGVLQGLGVSVNKLYQIIMIKRLGRMRYRELCANSMYETLSRGLTFMWFALTLLWFWSSWDQLTHIVALVGFSGIVLAMLLVFSASAALLAAAESAEVWMRTMIRSRYVRLAYCTALLVFTLSMTVGLNAPAPHVVYKAF